MKGKYEYIKGPNARENFKPVMPKADPELIQPHFGSSFPSGAYLGLFAFGKIDGFRATSFARTRPARYAEWSISFSRSMLLAVESDRADHLAVRMARMRHVAMRSDGPSFGQSG